MTSPEIRRLQLLNFRGFKELIWYPSNEVNIILGGGNAGKTTLLDAVALLLHPSNSYPLADSDYWQRNVEGEFCIEAVMALPESCGIHRQNVIAWPWEWNGKDAVLPDAEAPARSPVYKLRVRGTVDLELAYEMVQPDDSVITLTTALRRGIGVVRLVNDERNDRDLRLIQGGGLDRFLADKTLRAKLGRKVALESVEGELNPEARARLGALDKTFGIASLPSELGLGFVGGAGISINALVGLTSKKDGVPLPLTSWGSGTRRLASLKIADALSDGAPITVVDELERGLEPYRQRRLMSALREKKSQIFVTTHSATVLSSAAGCALWYVDAKGAIGELPVGKVAAHQKADPEAFLARLTIVAEGSTEVGFIKALLTRFFAPNWDEQGICVTDGAGNEKVLNLLEALSSGGVRFAGFADCEPNNPQPGRWQVIKDRLGDLLLRWPNGCLEENILPFFEPDDLEALLSDPEDRRSGQRRKSLADRLGIIDSSTIAIKAAAGDRLMALVVEAATGHVPDEFKADRSQKNVYKSHASMWFKSVEGGQELAEKVFALGVWPQVCPVLLPFLNAIRQTLGADPLKGLAQ